MASAICWRRYKRKRKDRYRSVHQWEALDERQQIAGYRGVYVLRHDGDGEVEFAVLNLFDSLDAVRAFAGPDYAVPVLEPEARQLLSKVEPIARHYEVKTTP